MPTEHPRVRKFQGKEKEKDSLVKFAPFPDAFDDVNVKGYSELAWKIALAI